MRRIALTLLLAASWPASAQVLPQALQRAIKQLSPSASVLRPREVDAVSCAPVPRSPGLVRADFNGDGRQDFAALVKLRVAPQLRKWEDKEYRVASMLFAIFVDDAKGGYVVRRIQEFEDLVPWGGAVIDIQRAGTVKGMEETVTLKHPGVALAFCEKSAAVYYVVGTEVREVVLSD